MFLQYTYFYFCVDFKSATFNLASRKGNDAMLLNSPSHFYEKSPGITPPEEQIGRSISEDVKNTSEFA